MYKVQYQLANSEQVHSTSYKTLSDALDGYLSRTQHIIAWSEVVADDGELITGWANPDCCPTTLAQNLPDGTILRSNS